MFSFDSDVRRQDNIHNTYENWKGKPLTPNHFETTTKSWKEGREVCSGVGCQFNNPWNKYVTLRQLVDPSGKYVGHINSRNIISNIGKQSLSNGRFGILIAVLMWDF